MDFDCLEAGEAATNWENGLFTAEEVAWAVREIRKYAEVVAGDLCGAYSPPQYARFRQRIEGKLDHPKLAPPAPEEAAARNLRSWRKIWPALTGEAA